MSATINVAAEVYATALAAYEAGLCVLPVKQDGTKAPDITSWASRQTTRSSREEIAHWFGNGHRSGLGYVTGAVSGNLELLDFDDPATYQEFCDLASAAGLTPLLDRIRDGYLEQSPGGVHLLYRCPEIAGNTKLARRTDEGGEIHVLIETRGEGGFVVAAPSNGRVHPSGGAYRLVRGGVTSIATISVEERAELHALARSLDAMPKEQARGQSGATAAEGRGKPGDDYNQRGDVLELLSDRGWVTVFERNGTTHLRRPGKELGTSATFATVNGKRYFYPFTSSTVFEAERAHSPFAVFATLEHGGDFSAAAQDLAGQGYGEPPATGGREAEFPTNASIPPNRERCWPLLAPEARYGLLGEVVDTLEPHTEADPAAVLVTLLLMIGNAAGRSLHTRVGGSRHGANQNAVIVGNTSNARKGTSYGEALRFMRIADPGWAENRLASGISSGEGLIHAVRDPVWGVNKSGEAFLQDAGVDDKRLMVVEQEFSSTLKVSRREGNTSTEVQRQLWDGNDPQTMTRKDPLRATKPHVSIIGHITVDELHRTLDETSQTNGYVNRFLVVCAKRSKLLPHGGSLAEAEVQRLAERLTHVLETARRRGALRRTPAADAMWEKVYEELTADRPGLFGSITARAAAHVLRLSLIYALLDEADAIDVPHLEAALALWEYCEDSARYLFGDAIGDPVADRVLTALRRSSDGMRQSDLQELFGKSLRAAEFGRSMDLLLSYGLVTSERVETGGRPAIIWRATK